MPLLKDRFNCKEFIINLSAPFSLPTCKNKRTNDGHKIGSRNKTTFINDGITLVRGSIGSLVARNPNMTRDPTQHNIKAGGFKRENSVLNDRYQRMTDWTKRT